MEDFTNDLKKLVKAGIGIVSEGLNKSAKMIDSFAEKGEPIYKEAVETVSKTADKVKAAVKNTMNSSDMKALRESLEKLSREQLAQASKWIDDLLHQDPGCEEKECGEDACADEPQEECREEGGQDACCQEGPAAENCCENSEEDACCQDAPAAENCCEHSEEDACCQDDAPLCQNCEEPKEDETK